jgi:hypothetical protein
VIVRLGIAYQLTCFVNELRCMVERLPTMKVVCFFLQGIYDSKKQGPCNLLENVVYGIDATMNEVIMLFNEG